MLEASYLGAMVDGAAGTPRSLVTKPAPGFDFESFFSAPVYAVPKASPYYVDEMFSSVIGVVTSPLKLCDLQACSSQAETKRQICMSTK